jgi:hypothetical protein
MSYRLLLAISMSALFSGCAQPVHLSYDFGRSYSETMTAQADLSRPAIAMTNYHLYGLEAVSIRLNVESAAQRSEAE